MSGLISLLAQQPRPGILDILHAVDTIPFVETSLRGEEFERLADAIHDVDPRTAEAFLSQLALAERLEQDPDKIAKLRFSLAEILRYLTVQDEDGFREALQSHFGSGEETICFAPESLNGSHWRFKRAVNEILPPSLEPPLPQEIRVAEDQTPPQISPNFATAQALGKRDSQQDYALNFEGKLLDGRKVIVSIVTDGNQSEGEIASQVAAQAFMKRLLGWLALYSHLPLAAIIAESVQHANQQVSEWTDTGKTTLVAYIQVGSEKYVINIGDSQAFFLPQVGEYSKITFDHALGNRLIRQLGIYHWPRDPSFYTLADPDFFVPTMLMGGLLFLMSDGLEGELGESVARAHPTASLQEIAREIILQMMQTFPQARDNMTVNVVRVDP